MKRKVVSKLLAAALSATMVLGGLTACGSDNNESTANSSNSSQSTNTASNSAASSNSGAASSSTTEAEGPRTFSFEKMTIYLPGDNPNTYGGGNAAYDRIIDDINEKIFGKDSKTKIEWSFTVESDVKDDKGNVTTPGYYTIVTQDLATPANLADVVRFSNIPSDNASFIDAAEKSGVFWDLAPYIELKNADGSYVYPNLAAWKDIHKAALNYYGKVYGLPLSRTNSAREGWGYRRDWYDNLNLTCDPTTLEGFEEMLDKFTNNDPDGNGLDDTVGLFLDSWTGAFNIMQLWFGVPNGWGVDKNGDLIPAHMTEEYKTALAKFREWYQAGYINQDFRDVGAGWAINANDQNRGLRYGQGGIGVQVLDGLRKVETQLETDGVVAANAPLDEAAFALEGYVDTGKGAFRMPQKNGMNGYISITKTGNIKTEEQLKDALYVLDQLSEGWYDDLFTWGWEGKPGVENQQATYYIGDDGYANKFDGKPEGELTADAAYGSAISKWSNGFNQVITYNYAPGHETVVPKAPYENPTQIRENELYKEGLDQLVFDAHTGCVSDTYTEKGKDLDAIIENARMSYITDSGFTEANLEAEIQRWLDNGGQKVINEMNAAYHSQH